MSRFDRISPTARFTGAVWRRHGLSPAALHSRSERALAGVLRGAQPLSRRLLVEDMLLARHSAIDAALIRAIHSGAVTQVVELAAGHSARGWRMKQRFGAELRYVETDLPTMARAKHGLLRRHALLTPGHEVRALDATLSEGDHSLRALLAGLDGERGVAIISEGLLNYLPMRAVDQLWQTAATRLAAFPASLYLADVYLAEDNADLPTRAFIAGLSLLVRGKVRLHFRDAADLRARAARDGWREVAVMPPMEVAGLDTAIARAPGAQRLRILRCSAHGSPPGA